MSDHLGQAKAAIAEIERAEREAEAGRERRDQAIVAMNRDDGMRAPQIGKALNMSTSNVRNVLRLADARDHRTS